MEKEQFIAMSLFYKLKCQFREREDRYCREKEIGTISGIYDDGSIVCSDTINSCPSKFKLILRPLSDLNKEIEHNGEKFVPIEWFEIGDVDNDSIEYNHGNIKLIKTLETIATYNVVHDIAYLPFAVVLKLIEWHFDIASLISEGEAIDVNILNINPYK